MDRSQRRLLQIQLSRTGETRNTHPTEPTAQIQKQNNRQPPRKHLLRMRQQCNAPSHRRRNRLSAILPRHHARKNTPRYPLRRHRFTTCHRRKSNSAIPQQTRKPTSQPAPIGRHLQNTRHKQARYIHRYRRSRNMARQSATTHPARQTTEYQQRSTHHIPRQPTAHLDRNRQCRNSSIRPAHPNIRKLQHRQLQHRKQRHTQHRTNHQRVASSRNRRRHLPDRHRPTNQHQLQQPKRIPPHHHEGWKHTHITRQHPLARRNERHRLAPQRNDQRQSPKHLPDVLLQT